VIPVGDSVRSRSAPVANWTLIIVNFLVFFVELAQGPHAEAFLSRWALIPAALTGAVSPPPGALPPVLTIFTAMFLHGGWGHILGNMLFLWIFGDNVEDAMGSLRYVVFYLLCGVIASLAQVAMMPDATVPNLGASGAISGVLGAYILMYPRARVTVVIPLFLLFPFLDVPAWLMLGLWFLTQFTNGLASLANTVQTGGVAFWAHIGGFVAGLVLVNFFRRRRYVPQWPISYQ
jgi:membrane associated rhomboid family serine protease